MDKPFSSWLLEEIEKRGMSQATLARRAGLSRTAISNYINEQRNPTPSALESIAYALGLSSAAVFQAAGILPTDPDIDDPSLDELIHTYRQMPPEAQEDLLALSRTMLDSHKKREKRNREPKTQPRPSGV